MALALSPEAYFGSYPRPLAPAPSTGLLAPQLFPAPPSFTQRPSAVPPTVAPPTVVSPTTSQPIWPPQPIPGAGLIEKGLFPDPPPVAPRGGLLDWVAFGDFLRREQQAAQPRFRRADLPEELRQIRTGPGSGLFGKIIEEITEPEPTPWDEKPRSGWRPGAAPAAESGRGSEPGIYIEAKEAPGHDMHGKWHAYLVYRDEAGNESVIRGGKESLTTGEPIEVQAGVPLWGSKDAYRAAITESLGRAGARSNAAETMKGRRATKIDLGGRAPAEVWTQMVGAAKQIGKQGIDYRSAEPFLWGEGSYQNSNSVVAAALHEAGIPAGGKTMPRGLKIDDLPGIENPLALYRARPDRLGSPYAPPKASMPAKGTAGPRRGPRQQPR